MKRAAWLCLPLYVACGDPALPQGDAGLAGDGGRTGDATSRADGGGRGEPMANVYAVNPVEDQRKTVQVRLNHLTDPKGFLTGKYANVFNCTRKDGGEKISAAFGGMSITGRMCKMEKVATSGPDGSYLHIKPASESDGNDPFAEVMMYHHVTSVHDYFADTLGFKKTIDRSLRALVNVQAYVDLLGRWMSIPNAAFVPKETGSFFQSFGVDLNKGEDTIIFAQADAVDMSYDASVINHEYTHAVIGMALSGLAYDEYGVDPSPGALNEGFADYFAASHLNVPTIGTYALANLGGARDLRRKLLCPGHLVGEVHHDGEVAAGALWAARTILTPQVADKAFLGAVLGLAGTTGFEGAAQALLAEVKLAVPDKHDAVKALFEEYGLLGCKRLLEHKDYDYLASGSPLAPRYFGTLGSPAVFTDGVPGFVQYKVEGAADTKELVIEYVPLGQSMSGLLGGGGATKGDVAVALRKGDSPITYAYGTGKAVSTAHVVLKGADDAQGYKLTVSGSCLTKGTLVFQFVGKGTEGGELKRVKVTQSAVASGAPANFSSCP